MSESLTVPHEVRNRQLLSLVVILDILVACNPSQTDINPAQEQIPLVINDFMIAMEARNFETAYDLFSSSAQQQTTVSDLETMYEYEDGLLFNGYDGMGETSFQLAKVSTTGLGQTGWAAGLPSGTWAKVVATGVYKSEKNAEFDAIMELEGNVWQIYYIYIKVASSEQ